MEVCSSARLNRSVSVNDSPSFPVAFQHKASSKLEPSGLVKTRTSCGAWTHEISTPLIDRAAGIRPLHDTTSPASWEPAEHQ